MEICHFGLSKGLTGAFYGCERVEKTFWFVVSSYLKDSAFKAVERDASFKPGIECAGRLQRKFPSPVSFHKLYQTGA